MKKKQKKLIITLSILILLLVIAAFTLLQPNKPSDQLEFTSIDFELETNQSKDYNYIFTYSVYNPLEEDKDCYIDFNINNPLNSSRAMIPLGIIKSKQGISDKYTFNMPNDNSNQLDVKLECN